MIRVGFSFEMTGSWIGGINYFRSLIAAIIALPERHIVPVIFAAASDTGHLVGEFPDVEIIPTDLLARKTPVWWGRRLAQRLTGRDLLLERLLKQHRIHILSHSGSLGRGSSIPSIGWVADFQHRRLPELCSDSERRARDQTIHRWCRECAALFLSSQSAKRDFAAFYGAELIPLFVVPFVPATRPLAADKAARVIGRYHLPSRYFYVPNQFWVHKNHRLVIAAARLLSERGTAIEIVFTGGAQDYRHPQHYPDLMKLAQPIAAHTHFLGVVPYQDVLALMQGALAVINPSRFEGWSTTAEEARNLGKSILLSDIDVHREQAPPRAVFFDPDRVEDLAEKMWSAWHNAGGAELGQMDAAAVEQRQRAFGAAFQDAVLMTHSAGLRRVGKHE